MNRKKNDIKSSDLPDIQITAVGWALSVKTKVREVKKATNESLL